jgi:hypothetical protein
LDLGGEHPMGSLLKFAKSNTRIENSMSVR